jgi:hypothetical protein
MLRFFRMYKMFLVGVLLAAGQMCVTATPIVPSCGVCNAATGFETTQVEAWVLASGSSGSDSVTLHLLGNTNGAVRPGFIQIAALSDVTAASAGTAFLGITIGDYHCTMGPGAPLCNLWGGNSSSAYLPFTLGAPFDIVLQASYAAWGTYGFASAMGSIQFSLYEATSMPGNPAFTYPGSAVIVHDPPLATPEPATLGLVGGALALAALARRKTVRRGSRG